MHHHVTPPKPVNTVIPLPKTIINNLKVLESVADRPRSHLGHGYYRSALKPRSWTAKRDFAAERGFASTPDPLPRFEGKENCTFTVKIPSVYLDQRSREEITSRRAIWGTDIYTDDSDIIAACIHAGWFRGAWSPDVDVSLLDLDIEPEAKGAVQAPTDIDGVIAAPPATGPMHVPPNRDCHVTILILPLLQKYSSLVRFGIKSREWGGKHDGYRSIHDGLSFMISSIRWVRGVDGEEGRVGKERKPHPDLLIHQEMEDTPDWSRPSLNNLESYVRGAGHPEMLGFVTASVWKGAKSAKRERGKEREKEKEKKMEMEKATKLGASVETASKAQASASVPPPISAPPAPVISIPTTPVLTRPAINQPLSPPAPEAISPITPKNKELDVVVVHKKERETPERIPELEVEAEPLPAPVQESMREPVQELVPAPMSEPVPEPLTKEVEPMMVNTDVSTTPAAAAAAMSSTLR